MTVDDWKWYDYYEFYVRMVVVVEEDAWSWLSLLWNEDPSSSFVATGIILWSVGIYTCLRTLTIYININIYKTFLNDDDNNDNGCGRIGFLYIDISFFFFVYRYEYIYHIKFQFGAGRGVLFVVFEHKNVSFLSTPVTPTKHE